jgi:hypothetical protein
MAKGLFSLPPVSSGTKRVLLFAGIGLATLAVYEFSENAGQAAGSEIGTAAIVVGGGAAVALVLFVLL